MTRARKPRKTHAEQVTVTCPNKDAHTPSPNGYLQWHAWAEEMAATHDSTQCPSCSRWSIWVLATDLCPTCAHPVSRHPEEDGDAPCQVVDCECWGAP